MPMLSMYAPHMNREEFASELKRIAELIRQDCDEGAIAEGNEWWKAEIDKPAHDDVVTVHEYGFDETEYLTKSENNKKVLKLSINVFED